MIWIGLTGGIACGKSTVARLLRDRGYAVIDADQLAREVVLPGTDGHREVIAEFGPDSVLSSGDLNRKRIGEIVFQDREKLSRLESMIHPRVRALQEKKRAELIASGHAVAFYDVPLLFEKNMRSMFDRVVTVACSPAVQKRRLMERDGFSNEEAERRIRAQVPIKDKIAGSDHVIMNDGSLADLELAVNGYIGQLSAGMLK